MAVTQQNLFESGSELRVEDVVQNRVERAVEVSEPKENAVEDVALEVENGREEN